MPDADAVGIPPAPRQQARERAILLLYEAELKGISPGEVLSGLPVPPDPFTVSLLQAVQGQREHIDHLIAEASIGWPLGRMAVVDRIILRVASTELIDPGGPPVAVVIDQAVRLARTYSTDDSGRFVNGVLSSIVRSLGGEPEDSAANEASQSRDQGGRFQA